MLCKAARRALCGVASGIVPVHGFIDLAVYHQSNALTGMLCCNVQLLQLLLGEPGQHPVRQIVIRPGLLPHPQLDPGKGILAGEIDDALDAVVSPVATLPADPQPRRAMWSKQSSSPSA